MGASLLRVSVLAGVAVVAWWAPVMPGGPQDAHGEEAPPPLKSAQALLLQAHDQLEIAIHLAELAVGPPQAGQGGHRSQVQRAINALVGEQDSRFDPSVESPGDGHGAIPSLKEAHERLRGCRPLNACEAIESTLAYLSAALDHAQGSIRVRNRAGLAQRQARLFAALLVVARGKRLTENPVTGAMAYAIRAVELERAAS